MQASVRWAALWLVWVGASGLAQAARPTTDALLERAGRQAADAEYEQALVTLQDALAAPDVSNEALALIHWRRGEMYVYLGRTEAAADAFERLLYVRSDWTPPERTPPHVRQAFASAKAAYVEHAGRLELTVPAQTPPLPGRPIPFGVQVRHLPDDFTPRVFFRQALTEAWQSAQLVAGVYGEDGYFTATLPAFPGGSTLEFYVEVQDAWRRRVVGDGSALAPRSMKVEDVASFAAATVAPVEAKASRWWLWAAVGGAVVATGAIAWVASRDEPARLELRVTVTP